MPEYYECIKERIIKLFYYEKEVRKKHNRKKLFIYFTCVKNDGVSAI